VATPKPLRQTRRRKTKRKLDVLLAAVVDAADGGGQLPKPKAAMKANLDRRQRPNRHVLQMRMIAIGAMTTGTLATLKTSQSRCVSRNQRQVLAIPMCRPGKKRCLTWWKSKGNPVPEVAVILVDEVEVEAVVADREAVHENSFLSQLANVR
jgi:hypothetical protein